MPLGRRAGGRVVRLVSRGCADAGSFDVQTATHVCQGNVNVELSFKWPRSSLVSSGRVGAEKGAGVGPGGCPACAGLTDSCAPQCAGPASRVGGCGSATRSQVRLGQRLHGRRMGATTDGHAARRLACWPRGRVLPHAAWLRRAHPRWHASPPSPPSRSPARVVHGPGHVPSHQRPRRRRRHLCAHAQHRQCAGRDQASVSPLDIEAPRRAFACALALAAMCARSSADRPAAPGRRVPGRPRP